VAGQDWMDQGTLRRKQIVKFIKDFTRTEKFAPTQQEIADALGLYKNSVQYHLAILGKEGVVTSTPGKARSIRVVSKR
jgi:SOS-response transcriptional repressor LexA